MTFKIEKFIRPNKKPHWVVYDSSIWGRMFNSHWSRVELKIDPSGMKSCRFNGKPGLRFAKKTDAEAALLIAILLS